MSISSNLGEIEALLDRLAAGIDFTAPGAGASIGEEALDAVAEGIGDRCSLRQGDPDGRRWDDNRGKYGEAKRDAGVPIGVSPDARGHRGGDMLSLVQLKGTRDVRPATASVAYGITPFARRKAQWFTNGSAAVGAGEESGAKGQPPRPFWGLDDAIRDRVRAIVADGVRAFLDSLGGA